MASCHIYFVVFEALTLGDPYTCTIWTHRDGLWKLFVSEESHKKVNK